MVNALKRNGVMAAAAVMLAAGGAAVPTAASANAHAKPKVAVAQININRTVTFPSAPVGGWTSLTLYSNGYYGWSGHMHDSGAPSYTYSGTCVVRFSNGAAFAFGASGRLHGTFESGSRDYNWNKSGYISSLPSAWSNSPTYRASCGSRVGISVSALVDSVIQGIGYVAQVVRIFA
jgi:hypothetical protein